MIRHRLALGLALSVSILAGCGERAGVVDGLGAAAGLGGSAGGSALEAAPHACDAGEPLFVVSVIDHEFGPGQGTGQAHFPELVLGPPHGTGKTSGSTDHVVSLGDGGFVELGFGDRVIVDGLGADFIVFENAFFIGGDSSLPYAELGQVSVSRDGSEWVAFPCHSEAYPYGSCAGWHPVLANPDTNDLDPTDAQTAGGDSFDLSELGLDWVRYVRIDDLVDDKELTFDLDAVAVVHPGCF